MVPKFSKTLAPYINFHNFTMMALSKNNGMTQQTLACSTKKSSHRRSNKARRRRRRKKGAAYKQLMLDCIHVIMQFHLAEVRTPVHALHPLDAEFYANFVVCFQFGNVSVHDFFEQTIRNPKQLRYVDARMDRSLQDITFRHFQGIHTLRISYCSQPSITDKAFAHLEGIQVLDMEYCNQKTITSQAFKHLRGIHSLKMTAMSQIGDEAFQYLQGIHTLHISWCRQLSDSAFRSLQGVKHLEMRHCDQLSLTSKAFPFIKGVEYCDLSYCNQPTIRQEAFEVFSAGTQVLVVEQTNVAPHMLGKLVQHCKLVKGAARCSMN